MAQRLKHPPVMQETWVGSLGWEDPLEKEMATHSSILAWGIPWMGEHGGAWWATVHDWATSLTHSKGFPGGTSGKELGCQCRRHEMQVGSLAWVDPLEKERTTHSSILAWRIPWTEEPGGLQSIVLHRVRYDWSNLAC